MTKHTLILLSLAACAAACGGDGDEGPPETFDARVFVVGTDFSTAGIASTVYLPSLYVDESSIDGVASTDPVLRRFGDRVYVVNRFGADNVTIVDADQEQVIAQISTGSGSNPQDVAVVGDKIYVAALGAPGVLVLDASAPQSGVVATIDLSELDPDDGLPNCSSLVAAGGRLYVACQILDDDDAMLPARGPGQISVIDTADDSVVTTVALQNPNPLGFVYPAEVLDGDLVVATVPNFGDLTEGCLERIALSDPPVSSCLIENSELGGYASAVAEASDGALLIAVTESFDTGDFGPLGFVVSYDPEEGLAGSPMTASSHRPFDVAVCPSGDIAMADAAGGVRVFSASGQELTSELLDIGLPPAARGLTCF